MAFTAVPFALQNQSHSADLFRQAVSSLVPPGGGIVTTGDLTVTQTGTPSMNVLVGVGRIWIPGTNVGNVTGGNFSSQAMYYGQNDAPQTVTIATSDPVNPRIDVVYAYVQDSQYSGSMNAGGLSVVSGVPTSGATYPANAPAIPANAKALAWTTVAANASSILNANITMLTTMAVGRKADVPWTNIPLAQGFDHFTGSGWSGLKYCVKSDWVMIDGAVQRGTAWAADTTCAVIPSAYKPAHKIQGTGPGQIEPTVGNITLAAGSGSTSFSLTYPLF